jgi:AmmeMemoRadiSam system protein B
MSSTSDSTIRPSAIAGQWYPGSAPALRRTVEEFLAAAPPVALPGPVIALVSPHAGYAYSGPTAGHAFAQVRGAAFRRVILLGPLHRPIWGSRLGAFMVPQEAAYRTPLGDVPLDRAFIAALGRRVLLTPVQRDEEHSLEIELPFLQAALAAFTLVPIMLGEHIGDPGARARVTGLATALTELCDDGTLLVASTDLSHLDNYADVVRTDRRLAELLVAFAVDGLAAALATAQAQACGATGLVAVLEAAQKRGARGVQVLAQTTSGDVTGKKQPGVYTVGYLAAAAYR